MSVDSPRTGRSYWDRHARRYDRSVRLLGRGLPRLLALAREEARGLGDVLEVAAGTGLVTAAVAPEVGCLVATDSSPEMLEVLRRRVEEQGLRNVECLERNLYALGFPPRIFDGVVCANALHLVDDLPGALRAISAVLKPGGKLIAPTFCHAETGTSRLVSRALALTGFPGSRRFTAADLSAALAAGGFTVERQETIPGLIPVSFVSARREP